MRRYRYEIDNVRAHLRSLWAVIAIQVVIIAALWFGWSGAPERLTVHIPPDLRSGAVLAVNEVSPPKRRGIEAPCKEGNRYCPQA
jgi:hypothetical protein